MLNRAFKKKSYKQIIKGYQNKQKGRDSETLFEGYLDENNINFFKIEDGERLYKNSFIRKPQPFDYILFKDNQCYFTDVKSTNQNRLSINTFYTDQEDVKTSTHRQFKNFLKMYKNGIHNCFFSIMHEDNFIESRFDIHKLNIYTLSIKEILNLHHDKINKKRKATFALTELTKIKGVIK